MAKTRMRVANRSTRLVPCGTSVSLTELGTGVKVSRRSSTCIDVGRVDDIMYTADPSNGVEASTTFCRVTFCEPAVRDTWLDPFKYARDT